MTVTKRGSSLLVMSPGSREAWFCGPSCISPDGLAGSSKTRARGPQGHTQRRQSRGQAQGPLHTGRGMWGPDKQSRALGSEGSGGRDAAGRPGHTEGPSRRPCPVPSHLSVA